MFEKILQLMGVDIEPEEECTENPVPGSDEKPCEKKVTIENSKLTAEKAFALHDASIKAMEASKDGPDAVRSTVKSIMKGFQ